MYADQHTIAGVSSTLPRDPLEKSRNLCQHRGLALILHMQEVTDTVDLDDAYIAETQSEQCNLLVRHHRSQLCLAPDEQHGALDPRKYLSKVVAFGKAVEVVHKTIEVRRVELPEASGENSNH